MDGKVQNFSPTKVFLQYSKAASALLTESNCSLSIKTLGRNMNNPKRLDQRTEHPNVKLVLSLVYCNTWKTKLLSLTKLRWPYTIDCIRSFVAYPHAIAKGSTFLFFLKFKVKRTHSWKRCEKNMVWSCYETLLNLPLFPCGRRPPNSCKKQFVPV